ncbi:DNA methyltransferase [Streptomyces sp. PKU-MA01144]|uniref:type ISP restriction/modification enzyme n=1 Tax=Streptomyces TaxID=1883 RepID=UPI001481107B|nr:MULTISPECIES: type ISP restriction/modification enzyme [Streptomyces]MCY0981014.1 DNA methyltransferase [Streptomyces tirandamycinicus]NNJ08352.1 DNA methyltransferase [Streptomyces sp. PKU-MA01144]
MSGQEGGAGGAVPLDDVMPWSTGPLRLGRGWIVAPDAGTLRARWDALVAAGGRERAALFQQTRARGLGSSVAALPGQATGTGRFAAERGTCPEPVRIAHAPFDQQWIIPDHRLIDVARPELWRVADGRQLFAVEQGRVPGDGGPAVLVTGALPEGRGTGRPGRIRPLYRRPGAREPNLAPGLLAALRERFPDAAEPGDVLAWVAAAGRPTAGGCEVPFTADPGVWERGVRLGRRLIGIQLRGARDGERPRLPGGRRPYVRAAVPARPATLVYDPQEEALLLDGGRIAPVPAGAWDFRVGGVRVLEDWFARRTAEPAAGTLEALGPPAWPQEWTSELLELVTVLALLGQLDQPRAELGADIARTGWHDLRVPPAPRSARAPASVLDHREEGPGGQFVLL